MRKVEQAVYRIFELEGEARERAFDWARDDMCRLEQEEIWQMPEAIMQECLNWEVTRADLEKAAEKIGHVYALDLVDELIARSNYHGAKRADYVENGLKTIASEKSEEMFNRAFDYFPDSSVIEMAEANDWEFTENGEFYR